MSQRAIGLGILAIGVVSLGYAGGIDILSTEEWMSVLEKWTSPPSLGGEQRKFALVMGVVALIAGLIQIFGPQEE